MEACWVDCWEQIERMPKLPPRASSTSAQGATHPPFYWNINQPPIQWHQILFHSFENWKMPSATSLTVALTMKTNTPVFSIGFQYIRQLAKFGRKRSFIQTPPFSCTRLWRSWSKRFPSLFFNIKLPFFWPQSVPLSSQWQLLLLLTELLLSTSCAYWWLPSAKYKEGIRNVFIWVQKWVWVSLLLLSNMGLRDASASKKRWVQCSPNKMKTSSVWSEFLWWSVALMLDYAKWLGTSNIIPGATNHPEAYRAEERDQSFQLN